VQDLLVRQAVVLKPDDLHSKARESSDIAAVGANERRNQAASIPASAAPKPAVDEPRLPGKLGAEGTGSNTPTNVPDSPMTTRLASLPETTSRTCQTAKITPR
jgi:hypothetical protein